MKNLLNLVALAVLFTSCSVDPIDNDQSLLLDENTSKTVEKIPACLTYDLVNDDLEYRGTYEIVSDYWNDEITITVTVSKWKVREAKMFLGPIDATPATNPELFNPANYQFVESYKDDTYIIQYTLVYSEIEKNSVLMAKLILSNDNEMEDVAPLTPSNENGYAVIEGFLSACFKG